MPRDAARKPALTPEQLQRFDENRILVYRCLLDIKAHQRKRTTLEDLMQAGYEGLLRAARAFHPERGSFGSYARPWIRWQMLMEAGLTKRKGWRKAEFCYGLDPDRPESPKSRS